MKRILVFALLVAVSVVPVFGARTFANQTTDKVLYTGGPILYNQTAASIMCWFKHSTASSSGTFHELYFQQGAFNKHVKVEIIVGGGNQGKMQFDYRTPTANPIVISSGTVDDGAWHRLLCVRRNASPFEEMYIDGVSVGSSTTDAGTDATALTDTLWGQSIGLDSSFGGSLARCALLSGVTLTPSQADAFLYFGILPGAALSQWLEMIGVSPEPDWSGNGLAGTLTATSIGNNPPYGGFGR